MRTRSFVSIGLLVLIAGFALLWFGRQRSELGEIREQIRHAESPSNPMGGYHKPPTKRIPGATKIGNADQQAPDSAELTADFSDTKRVEFLKQMSSLVRIHDSGMTTFIPDRDYSEKIHAMDAATLKELLSDLEGFQTHFSKKSMMKGNLLNSLVRFDPAYVLEVAHEGGNQKWSFAMKTAIRNLTRTDPEAALEWINRAEWADIEWKNQILGTYAQNVATRDTGQALATIDQFQDYRDEFGQALGNVAMAAETAEERHQIATRLETIEDEDLQGIVRSKLVHGVLYREGFKRATEAFAQYFSGGGDETLVDIASEALQDGNGAEKADWVMALSQPERRADNIELFVRKWIGHDYNAAATWIGEMDLGAERDAAITVLVQKVAPFDPVGAEVWAQEIGSR